MLRILIMCIVVVLSLPAKAQNPDGTEQGQSVARVLGTDRFAAGESVSISEPVTGDLITAGRDVMISGSISGDTVAAGRSVNFNGNTQQNVYAAGSEVSINGVISRNARLAGGEVEMTPSSRVDGGVSIGAGQARLSGEINGYLQAAARELYINGPIDGDVEVAADQVRLGPDARIAGSLRYRSNSELYRDPAAQVLGGIERLPSRETPSNFGRVIFWIGTIGLMIMVALIAAAWPRFFAGVGEALRSRPGASALLGLAMLILVPIAAGILLVTLVGAPLALLAFAAYVMLLLVGYAATGAAVGELIWNRMQPQATRSAGRRIGAAVLGLLLVALVAQIPVLGGLVIFAALIVGMGAVAMFLRRATRPATPVAA